MTLFKTKLVRVTDICTIFFFFLQISYVLTLLSSAKDLFGTNKKRNKNNKNMGNNVGDFDSTMARRAQTDLGLARKSSTKGPGEGILGYTATLPIGQGFTLSGGAMEERSEEEQQNASIEKSSTLEIGMDSQNEKEKQKERERERERHKEREKREKEKNESKEIENKETENKKKKKEKEKEKEMDKRMQKRGKERERVNANLRTQERIPKIKTTTSAQTYSRAGVTTGTKGTLGTERFALGVVGTGLDNAAIKRTNSPMSHKKTKSESTGISANAIKVTLPTSDNRVPNAFALYNNDSPEGFRFVTTSPVENGNQSPISKSNTITPIPDADTDGLRHAASMRFDKTSESRSAHPRPQNVRVSFVHNPRKHLKNHSKSEGSSLRKTYMPELAKSHDSAHQPENLPQLDIFNTELVDICWVFWKDNVDILPRNPKKKIPLARRLFIRGNVDTQALKYLDMAGWLLRLLRKSDQASVLKSLQMLGIQHASWGIKTEYFLLFEECLHCALADVLFFFFCDRITYTQI
ncbi:hypothetical protein RFI_17959 [Reticulomyxa filosa]|uniref:Uncharacterized protein n=1 Tax=Reticulomyxa filosa TaxID=46433 RepID=X6MZM4_RETFI|nr:hypothetical protein RFI_17959 [Reticulomyxa filosa]|eukprot:ETO19271.1 hypothetical protein RFI_17959 [Reticulomyxa filosa]